MAYTIARPRRASGVSGSQKSNNVISVWVSFFFPPLQLGFLYVVMVRSHGVEISHRELVVYVTSPSRPKERSFHFPQI